MYTETMRQGTGAAAPPARVLELFRTVYHYPKYDDNVSFQGLLKSAPYIMKYLILRTSEVFFPRG